MGHGKYNSGPQIRKKRYKGVNFMNGFILKGDILYSKTRTELAVFPDSYLVCAEGKAAGIFRNKEELPAAYDSFLAEDYSGHLIIPGLCDLHIHAPQYMYRGLWMDAELLEWLNEHTFPEEAKFADAAFAEKAYGMFADGMRNGGTARLCVFATIHTDATLELMDLLEASGLEAYVGKVNMDRNAPSGLCEETAQSIAETKRWLSAVKERGYRHVRPILTPRFIPTCTDGLMSALGRLIRETGAALQSHLSENQNEIEWVRELCPKASFYGDAYERFGCFGNAGNKTVMAHCVWSTEAEIALMKKNGVFVAHSPSSNTNLTSGIAPVRKYLEEGLSVGLATDAAGGSTASIFRVMADAVQVSKLYHCLTDKTKQPLSMPEAFYLGTKGGGAFFGKCGSFEPGYAFDALVLSERHIPTALCGLTPAERLERFIYLGSERDILHKYVAGEKLF